MKIHIVQKGDTLWKIAQKYGVDFEELKQMNTQLSNPDLIMPGMKIKVPTGGVPVKTDTKINYNTKKEVPKEMPKKEMPKKETPKEMPKKEMPKVEHPYGMGKPKANVDVEDTKANEKPSKPFVPQMPIKQQPFYPDIDVHNFYTVNMPMMPEMKQQPQLPPKPANVLPNIMKQDDEMKDIYKEPMSDTEEEENESMTMPYMPQMPYMPMQPQTMPAYGGQWPQNCMPVSPVMPGPGFGPMANYGAPNNSYMYPQEENPEMMNDDHDEMNDHGGMVQGAQMHPGQGFYPNAPQAQPAYGMPYGMVPPGCVPVSPIMPGSGFGPMGYHPQPMMPSPYQPNMVSPEMMEDDGDDMENVENMAYPNMMYPTHMVPAPYGNGCGCGQPHPMMPYYGYPMAHPYPQPYHAYPPHPQGMYDYSRLYAAPQYDEEDED
ncbi:SafA/ExsA family spore coat assembly protein [Bacillus sp. FJAT-47783]|uniref:SafA/ExsA family spore coat assembly protein n=1 Tax=Bacillus sp. FJAT-47783 TaxID=2922712 RepID=UPI001FABA136